MLKLILDNSPPQPKTLEESHAVIKDLWQLVGELSGRIDQLEEQLGGPFRQLVTPALARQS